MNYNETLRAAIEASVKTPSDPRISGAILQRQMISIMGAVDAGAVFLGTATPATIPTTEANCFFLATTPGTYTHFVDTGGNPIVLAQGESALIRSVIYLDNLRWQKATLFTGGGSAQLAVSITYAALVALRDGGNLVPGTWYRITDYVCTTTQANTQAASNAFDILVHADDESHLNENAFAAHHDGDTYFQDCILEAWELKYCLDNDAARFGWADTANGTGVVYWMKDEWDNEAPYDFKNIKFSRTLTNGAYDAQGTAAYVYTFNSYTSGTSSDATVLAASNNKIRCCNNVITERRNTSSGDYKLLLNDNVFLNVYANNTGYNCSGNKFGFGSFGNTFGNNVSYNTFGNSFFSNTFGNSCSGNTFGNNCNNNTFGNSCQRNTFGNSCGGNTFGNYFQNNTFGNGCSGNTFGNNCSENTFGNDCGSNTFGNECYNNTFGNSCGNNTFGNYCRCITVFDGAEAFSVTTGSEGHYVQFCQVLGANYGGKTPLAIPFVADVNYTQIAGLDNNGDLQIFNPAAS